jgi:uncharacterized protein with FMN-binding domain
MKKFFVSSVVIVAFVAYSIYQRVFGTQTLPVITPSKINTMPSGFSQTIPTSTPLPTLTPTSIPTPIQSGPTQAGPSNTSTPVPQNTPIPTPIPSSGYKDGTYTGDAADAFYGNIQVQATIANGRITNIQFLQYPNDRSRSVYINSQADPMLAQEAIQAQSAQVDIISGATDSSQAFIQSMQSVLNKAKN